MDAMNWAEGLIRQLPETHEGRNSWLMNFSEKADAQKMRDEHPEKPERNIKHVKSFKKDDVVEVFDSYGHWEVTLECDVKDNEAFVISNQKNNGILWVYPEQIRLVKAAPKVKKLYLWLLRDHGGGAYIQSHHYFENEEEGIAYHEKYIRENLQFVRRLDHTMIEVTDVD